jgi:hypothetical protein
MWEGGTPPHPPTLSTAEPGNFDHLLYEGFWHMWYQPYQASFYNNGGFAHLTQTVTATPGFAYTMTGWSLFEAHYAGGVDNLNDPNNATSLTDGPPSPTDSYFALEFLDSGQTVLPGSVEIELRADGQMNDLTWRQHTLNAIAPNSTASVRVRASMTGGIWNQGADPQSFFVDAFTLTATTPTLTADFDGDDDVDGNDYLRWQRGLGIATGATKGQGDADGNGAVNGLDFVEWKAQYGLPAVAAAGAVPEPTTARLAASALALLDAICRNARRRWDLFA